MDKLKMQSVNLTDANIDKIAALFPNCITETADENGRLKKAVNFDMLKAMLSEDIAEGDEAYEFTWVGKKAAIAEANRPIRKTLRPCPEESVNWDTTENLYIEGDNLEVLKLLQESYLGKVKMIYIDPPYNTGNDFIYRDDFKQTAEEYAEESGQLDEEGNRLFKNTDSNGRFHSDWCSMIYSRLMLARNLLSDDGVIFISIDDNEQENLKKICDEVLGANNFIAYLVYDKNRKNDAKFFSVGHEYIIVYFKNISTYLENKTIFRESKEGVDEVKAEFERLRKIHGDNWELVNEGLKKLYSSWSSDDERKPLARFTKVDEYGPYRDDGNISWPGGGGPKYDVIHPTTGKPCKCPDAGWRFPTLKRMQEEIDSGRVVFGKDETTLPRIRRNLFEYDSQVMRSVHFSYAQTTTVEFNNIFDGKRIFENPKSVTDLKRLIRYVTNQNDIILDFFSGSATTAHAVISQNFQDVYDGKLGKRKFIMVQLPEPCDEKSEAYKAGFKNICEIGKERIRRAGKQEYMSVCATMGSSQRWDQTKRGVDPDYPCPESVDIGFRVLKLADSNMTDVYYTPAETSQQMLLNFESNIKEDRTDLDLLFGCLLDWGLPLSMPYKSEQIEGVTVHTYNDGDLIACFDKDISEDVIKTIAKRQPLRVVFRDSCFENSPAKINVEEIFKMMSPDTRVKVI